MPKRYCAKDPPIGSAGLKVGMRSQGEAEIASEQGETRYEGVAWTTRRQIVANRLIPLYRARPACTPTKSSLPPTRLSPRPLNSTPSDMSQSVRLDQAASHEHSAGGPSDHSPAKTGAGWALR